MHNSLQYIYPKWGGSSRFNINKCSKYASCRVLQRAKIIIDGGISGENEKAIHYYTNTVAVNFIYGGHIICRWYTIR